MQHTHNIPKWTHQAPHMPTRPPLPCKCWFIRPFDSHWLWQQNMRLTPGKKRFLCYFRLQVKIWKTQNQFMVKHILSLDQSQNANESWKSESPALATWNQCNTHDMPKQTHQAPRSCALPCPVNTVSLTVAPEHKTDTTPATCPNGHASNHACTPSPAL